MWGFDRRAPRVSTRDVIGIVKLCVLVLAAPGRPRATKTTARTRKGTEDHNQGQGEVNTNAFPPE